jgi:hypothetical protein
MYRNTHPRCSPKVSRIRDLILLATSEFAQVKLSPKKKFNADANTVSGDTVISKLHVITNPFDSAIGLVTCLRSAVFL